MLYEGKQDSHSRFSLHQQRAKCVVCFTQASKTLLSVLAFINIKCRKYDKQVHLFSLARCYRYNLEGRDMPAPVSAWWQDKWGCLNVRKGGWAPGADRHVSGHNDVAVKIAGCLILWIYYNLLDIIIIHFPWDFLLMALVLTSPSKWHRLVQAASSTFSPEAICW